MTPSDRFSALAAVEAAAAGGGAPAERAMRAVATDRCAARTVFAVVADLAEAVLPDGACMLLLLDEGRVLRPVDTGRQSMAISRTLAAGVPVRDAVTGVGAAAHHRRAIITYDIAMDNGWAKFMAAACEDKLAGCWEVPIISGESVRGTVAYFPYLPQRAAAREIEQLKGLAGMAALSLEHERISGALARQSGADPATGLPVWHRRADEAADLMAVLDDTRGGWAGLAAVEVGRIRECNEAFGFDAGDEVLRQAATRLATLVPASQLFRGGGETFLVPIVSGQQQLGLTDVVDRLWQVLAPAYSVHGTTFTGAPRIGVALNGADVTATSLVGSAVAALGDARRRGAPVVLADSAQVSHGTTRVALENELRDALRSGNVVVHYQPQHDLATGLLVGAEALLRWQHPEKGLLLPTAFLDVVEQAELHGELTSVVVDQVCRDVAAWRRHRPERPLCVSVNLSSAELAHPSLVSVVAESLDRHGLPGGSICLEITEQAALTDIDAASKTLSRLKQHGVRVAIDDFGTGYSSLSHACRLPIDQLKVDRTFVEGVATDPDDANIVATIVDLGARLGVTVVAEGVETLEQLSALQELGCHAAQGFLWSAAVPVSELLELPEHRDVAADGVVDRSAAGAAPTESTMDPGAILATFAHELRTPLAVMTIYCDLAEHHDEAHPGGIEVQRHQLALMAKILDDATDAMLLEHGIPLVQREPVDLAVLVRDTVRDLQIVLRSPVDLNVEADVRLHVDPLRIRQVLVNLLTNADRYTPAGDAIRIEVAESEDEAMIAVIDRGPGIPTAKVGHSFRRFGGLSDASGGLGLGLYISRQLARAHGGELAYRHGRPSGARFELTLPTDMDSSPADVAGTATRSLLPTLPAPPSTSRDKLQEFADTFLPASLASPSANGAGGQSSRGHSTNVGDETGGS